KLTNNKSPPLAIYAFVLNSLAIILSKVDDLRRQLGNFHITEANMELSQNRLVDALACCKNVNNLALLVQCSNCSRCFHANCIGLEESCVSLAWKCTRCIHLCEAIDSASSAFPKSKGSSPLVVIKGLILEYMVNLAVLNRGE